MASATDAAPITRMRDESWVRALDRLCLAHLGRDTTMVEIGCYAGESTQVFARHAGLVHAIDPWDSSYEREVLLGCAEGAVRDYIEAVGLPPMGHVERLFDERVRGAANVRKVKAFDDRVVHDFEDGSLDFLYIDSIHTFEHVSATIARWARKMRPGGIVGGHDYCERHWGGVVRAVDAAFGRPDEVFEDTSWIVRDAAARYRWPVAAADA